MTDSNNSKKSGFLEIKHPYDLAANSKLRDIVLSNLKDLYGDPLPEIVDRRINEELSIAADFGYAPVYLLHKEICDSIESCDYPFYMLWANGASLISCALGITKVDPLPPHYRCAACRYTEFVPDNTYDTGFLLPEKNCPKCGNRLIPDGQDLQIESFLGYRHDKSPYLTFGVASTRFDDAVSFIEKTFNAKQMDESNLLFSSEEGFIFCYIDILPLDHMFADKKAAPTGEPDDPAVYEYLSRPEAYWCYLPDEPYVSIIKELLEAVEIDNYSDLFKICGLAHCDKWLSFILPSLKSGAVNYRNVITAREDIYRYLVQCGIAPELSYRVMDMTRKGRAARLLEDENTRAQLLAHGVPETYIVCLKNIKYLMTHAQTRELAFIAYRNAQRKLSE